MSTDISAFAAYAAAPIAPARASPTGSIAAQAVVPSAPVPAAPAPRPSPVSLLDPSTGLVVLEFYNAKGVETSSLPTKKVLENYRLNEPSESVFQPTIHDGTVPQALPTGKSPVGALPEGKAAVQPSVTAQATGTAIGGTPTAQSTPASAYGGSAPFATEA